MSNFVLTSFDWILIVGIVLALTASIVSLVKMQKLYEHARMFFKTADAKEGLSLLNDCLARVADVGRENAEIKEGLARAHEILMARLRRPMLKRYNSFDDVGGNQSFSLVLLDGTNSGIIISSLHSRQGAIVYAKWVENGRPMHNLSSEEQEVLTQALHVNDPIDQLPGNDQ